jgi:hypothetical protein
MAFVLKRGVTLSVGYLSPQMSTFSISNSNICKTLQMYHFDIFYEILIEIMFVKGIWNIIVPKMKMFRVEFYFDTVMYRENRGNFISMQ